MRATVAEQVTQRAAENAAVEDASEPECQPSESECQQHDPIGGIKPDESNRTDAEWVILWRLQRSKVQTQQRYLDLARHRVGRAAAHGGITQAVYDGLNSALQAELKEYTRIRHVVMVEKDLDPRNATRWAEAYAA